MVLFPQRLNNSFRNLAAMTSRQYTFQNCLSFIHLISQKWKKFKSRHLKQIVPYLSKGPSSFSYYLLNCTLHSVCKNRKPAWSRDSYCISLVNLPTFSAVTTEAFNQGLSQTVAFWNNSHHRLWHLEHNINEDTLMKSSQWIPVVFIECILSRVVLFYSCSSQASGGDKQLWRLLWLLSWRPVLSAVYVAWQRTVAAIGYLTLPQRAGTVLSSAQTTVCLVCGSWRKGCFVEYRLG